MEIFQLRYLVAVAEKLNFTRAAETLNVSQSALSRQIQQLEAELGVPIFHRNRQRVTISDEGKVILRHAERILSEVSVLTRVAGDLGDSHGVDLCIGYDWRAFFNFIPDTIAEFRSLNPQFHITLKEIQPQEHRAALTSGEVHVVFTPGEFGVSSPAFSRQQLLVSEFVIAVSKSHAFADRGSVKLGELAGETWLLDDSLPKAYRTFIRKICRSAGFSPAFGKSGSGVEDILAMVAAGYGIAIFPRYIISKYKDIRSISMLETDCQPVEQSAMWLTANHSRALKSYLEILRKRMGDASHSLSPETGEAPENAF